MCVFLGPLEKKKVAVLESVARVCVENVVLEQCPFCAWSFAEHALFHHWISAAAADSIYAGLSPLLLRLLPWNCANGENVVSVYSSIRVVVLFLSRVTHPVPVGLIAFFRSLRSGRCTGRIAQCGESCAVCCCFPSAGCPFSFPLSPLLLVRCRSSSASFILHSAWYGHARQQSSWRQCVCVCVSERERERVCDGSSALAAIILKTAANSSADSASRFPKPKRVRSATKR